MFSNAFSSFSNQAEAKQNLVYKYTYSRIKYTYRRIKQENAKVLEWTVPILLHSRENDILECLLTLETPWKYQTSTLIICHILASYFFVCDS